PGATASPVPASASPPIVSSPGLCSGTGEGEGTAMGCRSPIAHSGCRGGGAATTGPGSASANTADTPSSPSARALQPSPVTVPSVVVRSVGHAAPVTEAPDGGPSAIAGTLPRRRQVSTYVPVAG